MDSPKPLNVLGIAGSLRKDSYNRGLLRVSQTLAPRGMCVEDYDISDIPLYNDDIYAKGFPDAVNNFRERIRAAEW
jgi:chromate reductase, NAD(P)H dehydrogenase (quinone)